LAEDLKQELASAFPPKGGVDLFKLLAFPDETAEKRDVRAKDFVRMRPFETYHSPGVDHLLIFYSHVEPELVTSLPTDLHGLRVDAGDFELVFLITSDTLAGINLEDLLKGVENRDSSRPVRECLMDIVAVLTQARENREDVVATIG
jgi:hypothetical protein